MDVDISNELLEGRDNSVKYDFMPFMSWKMFLRLKISNTHNAVVYLDYCRFLKLRALTPNLLKLPRNTRRYNGS